MLLAVRMRKPQAHNRFLCSLTWHSGLFLKDTSCPLRTGQMIFEKHLNASLRDTSENRFQFSLTKIKINLNL